MSQSNAVWSQLIIRVKNNQLHQSNAGHLKKNITAELTAVN